MRVVVGVPGDAGGCDGAEQQDDGLHNRPVDGHRVAVGARYGEGLGVQSGIACPHTFIVILCADTLALMRIPYFPLGHFSLGWAAAAALAGVMLAQFPAQAPAVIRKTVQTTDGRSIEGQVMGEGMSDLQLRTDDKKIVLLRKEGTKARVVTSQADWPTYNGDPGGNRYSKLTQIDASNVKNLGPRWMFNIRNATQIENTPLVVEGIMYVTDGE